MDPSDDIVSDSDRAVRDHFDRMTRVYLRSVLSDALIAEDKAGSDAKPSEPLARLRLWIQRRRLPEPFAIKLDADGAYRLVALPARRGVAPRPLDERRFASLAEARHAVFLLHVRDLQES